MENASKALIIAGPILIAILIISLGIMVFQNMSNSVKSNSSLTKEEIASFNNNITPYLGNNVSGSQVNVLIQKVRSINQKAITNEDASRRITITFPGTDGNIITLNKDNTYTGGSSGNVTTGGIFYTVKEHYGDNGLIDSIQVTKN